MNRSYVLDQLSVWQYTPSAQVASIAKKAALSEQGKFYFYASSPTIDTAVEFNKHCERQETKTAILGCYSNRKIYIYNVDNSQLNGIREVTAAHETLHAVWERMNVDEQQTIGELLEAAYATIDDPVLDERMDYYARAQPGERLNELHSILGTEYPDLGSELEAHYSKYFNDRNVIVGLHAEYQTVFNDLKKQSDALKADIEARETELSKSTETYNTSVAALEADYNALLARQSAVDTTSIAEVNQYNAELAALRTRADNLSVLRSNILTLQAAYNAKIDEYNKLVGASNSLLESLDSTLTPSPNL